MLCENCHRHFDFPLQDDTPAKEAMITSLRDCSLDTSGLESLHDDLNSYQIARRQLLSHPHVDNRPWIASDAIPSDLTEDARETASSLRVDVWNMKFQSAAETGCEMCLRLCEVIEYLGIGIEDCDVESWLVLQPVTLLPSKIEVRIGDEKTYEWLDFKVLERGEDEVERIQGRVARNSSSEEYLDELIACLRECALGHKQCQEKENDGWIPTRLVDIKEYEHSSTVRVASRDEIRLDLSGEQIRYLTLSHVWGGHAFLTLTTSNMQQLRSGIPVSRLSKNFRDAVDVTSRIGLRYLWVDSLCIIQGSEADWSAEAGLMNKVYSNSFCNLASSHSTHPSEGLFWARNSTLAYPFTVQCNPEPGTNHLDVYMDLEPIILNHAPLYKRGWVLQESYLSPRTIHFSRFPAFECREAFTCESYRTTGPKSMDDELFHTRKTVFEESLYDNWWEIVYDYSRCRLTVPTDKLIALSGITRALTSVVPGEYYGGIWEEWWRQGLLWRVSQRFSGDYIPPMGLSAEYVAPSWSWASVNGPIMPWTNDITKELVHLASIHTLPTNGDPFGQLRAGELVLKAKLFRFPSLKALDSTNLPFYAFSLDDCEGHLHDKDILFVPLVESPNLLGLERNTICGVLVRGVDGEIDRRKAFRRVGFAAVDPVVGSLADSGACMKGWTSPPWSEDELQHVVIV